MTKFLKRALSLAMASAAAMTMAISANAATYNTTYKGFDVGACVEANTEFKTQHAYTYYGSNQARVFVELTVTDAITGKVLSATKRAERGSDSLYVHVYANVDKSPITLSSKHEVIPAWSTGTSWTKYLEESYVVQ